MIPEPHNSDTQRSTQINCQKTQWNTHSQGKPRQKAPHKKVIPAVTFENFIKHPSKASSTMSINKATIPNPAKVTFHNLAYQAACDAKLISFAEAYKHDPANIATIAETFSKDFSADTRLAKLCDNRLVNQMAFMMEVPGRSAQLAVLSCPFSTTKGTEAVFAGSLSDSMDILCPVTIRMRDVCTTLYRASISRSRQYTLLLVSNTTVVHSPCTVFRYTGRLVIQ